MSKATLTKRTEFCSSHRYHNPDWDDAKNKEVFGPCNNKNTHGHNYMLEVTLCGPIDPVNGMIINLYDLKIYLWDVLKEFDHKNLNLDTPYFTERIPTTENLAVTLWERLEQHPHMPPLDRIRLFEDHTLFADVTAELLKGSNGTSHAPHADVTAELLKGSNGSSHTPHADVTRRYYFSAAQNLPNGHTTGHNYTMDITVTGPIAPDTGQVVNLGILDELVKENVVGRYDGKNLSNDQTFSGLPASEAHVARAVWTMLEAQISDARLTQITVSESPDTQATYRG